MSWVVVISVGTFGSLFVMYLMFMLGGLVYDLNCRRCNLRIAAVQVAPIRQPEWKRLQHIGKDARWSGKMVCDQCWIELEELGLRTDGNWWPGRIFKYLKDTPTFISMLLSMGALTISIIALTSD